MSGSSLDGLDLVFAVFTEIGGKWDFEIKATACYGYSEEWQERLKNATSLSALDYQLLDAEYGRYTGAEVNRFIAAFGLAHQVQLIGSHGHTSFHLPNAGVTAQLGNGATIAAVTGINTVSDLRIMDLALGGQGAPIVPMGEQLLFSKYAYLLNLGGIANISANLVNGSIAFDVCAANRVMNILCSQIGKEYDDGGAIAKSGSIDTGLLTRLNALDYYGQASPKSLANDFGTDIVYPLINSFHLSIPDALRTYVEHIAMQVGYAVNQLQKGLTATAASMLVTGGGAHNHFLVERITEAVKPYQLSVVVPEKELVNYKEALVMALLAVLRWREENTVLHTVTGASRSSIGGAIWIGQHA
jgi:anhydro-N-acetylmuramic acid kinase